MGFVSLHHICCLCHFIFVVVSDRGRTRGRRAKVPRPHLPDQLHRRSKELWREKDRIKTWVQWKVVKPLPS